MDLYGYRNIVVKVDDSTETKNYDEEGNLIKEHPEYKMEDRLLLDKVDYKKGTIKINNKVYELNDKNFTCSNSNGNVSIKQVKKIFFKK